MSTKQVDSHDMRTSTVDSEAAYNSLVSKLDKHTATVLVAEDFNHRPVHYTMQRYYGGDTHELHGYALLVDGATPVDGSTRSSHLIGPQLGTAIARFRITAPNDISAEEIERRWAAAHEANSIPHINALQTQFTVGAHTIVDPQALRDTRYITVHANDMPAALALVESTQRKPTTVARLVRSPAYRDLVLSSAHVRAQLAAQAARAIGVTIDADPELTTPTHAIAFADVLAHQTSSPQTTRDGTEQYVVTNETTDVSAAHGGVLVQQSPFGGYAHVQKSKSTTLPTGQQSRAWTTETMSIVGTNAPLHTSDSGESALHRNLNKETRKMFDAKVHWSGTLSTAHPRADERRKQINQALMHETARPKEEGAELRVTSMKMLAVQLPDHEPRPATTLAELVEHARETKANSLPVPLDSEAMRELTRLFDKLPASANHGVWADINNNSTQVPVDELHTVRSACNGKDHDHYWMKADQDDDYDDAEDEDEDEDDGGGGVGKKRSTTMYMTSNRSHPRMNNYDVTRVNERHETRVLLGTDLIRDLARVAALEQKKAASAAAETANGTPTTPTTNE